jgi:nicotinate-nucleotide adenylyltransferase
MKKIGVFGGTFNPPHVGHLLAAAEVKEALGLDQILFIPDAQPPHKNLPAGSPDGAVRLELLRAAVQDLDGAAVSDLELHRPGKSYTSDTLRLLKAQHPEDTLYLITGTDMFLTLHQWHEPEEICKNAVIVGMCRAEDDRAEELTLQKANLEQRYQAQVRLVDNHFVEISSTQVRRLLILGGAEKYVPQPVLDLIREQGLYGVGRDYKNLSGEELREVAVHLLKPQRVNHVLGCAETAVKLARLNGADETVALRAGLLHDITKAIDGEDQLLLVDKYDILISDFERKYPKLLHAKTGAAVAKYVFGESPEVVEAIYWHTTGKADMSLMEKIVYLADYMEPNRSFPGVEPLRELAFRDLDRGLLMGFDMCIEELIREKKPLCTDSAEARDFLRAQLATQTTL